MIRSLSWNDLLFFLSALNWTVLLASIACLCGGVLGLGVALARVARSQTVRALASTYIQIVQGTPVLMLLFLSYYGLSLLGFDLPPMVAASVSMSIYVSGYLGDIWRGSIQSVAKQQWEASESLGMTRTQQYRHVILPQAIKISLPPTVGFMVQVVKNSSIASIIGFVELAKAGQLINNVTFQPFAVFLIVAALYFCVCYPLSHFSRKLERKSHA
ncbi:MAG: L-cystine transport system permease protein YecS [Paracidovorax wautersii]|uniref:L-cystine transport system permease protein YecS n=1 Tax=Paracidovorax wautersii TaxID=1177982 RepID=A0A7V8FN06_9BURK|nr:MAG: L-cystine transport system permease protein YecS [Paracidovorax wautersii]